MRVAVKDANVFIDLESMGILDLWFQLGYETLTTSFVIIELENGNHLGALAYVSAGKVTEAIISMNEMGAFDQLREAPELAGLSITDLPVLFVALREGATLLSGDKLLRKQAGLRHVEVHGTLWILDELVSKGTLPPRVAAQKLEALLNKTGTERRYLPQEECKTRIARWKKQTP